MNIAKRIRTVDSLNIVDISLDDPKTFRCGSCDFSIPKLFLLNQIMNGEKVTCSNCSKTLTHYIKQTRVCEDFVKGKILKEDFPSQSRVLVSDSESEN